MRGAFALLALGLVAVSAWAVWDDAHPEWRRYQRELVRREIVRLEAELAAARREAERPEVRAEVARLDRLLAREAGASESGSGGGIALRIAAAEDDEARLRAAVRSAERELAGPAAGGPRGELLERLKDVQARYAAATGTWPPDRDALAALWTERDSLSAALERLESPARELRKELDARRAELDSLRDLARAAAASRDGLERARRRLVAPVEDREAALARLRATRPGVREIVSPDGREVARCPTCHGMLDDPPGAHPALPAAETFRDVPCTACHRGAGRALDVEKAHRGLLAGAGSGAGPYSLWARIERLRVAAPADRPEAIEELQRLTGADPVAAAPVDRLGADPDTAAVTLWTEWWNGGRAPLDPDDGASLTAAGVDAWRFSLQGRPLRYVGSRECLACHETRHREHSRRWLPTKFRSLERLADEPDPGACLECHATGWDPATGAYAEPGVTCEGCHGPGERYNAMMVTGQELLAAGNDAPANELLDRASRLAREAVSRRSLEGDSGEMNVCVRCHHPRRHRDRGPGELERDPPAVRVAATEETP